MVLSLLQRPHRREDILVKNIRLASWGSYVKEAVH